MDNPINSSNSIPVLLLNFSVSVFTKPILVIARAREQHKRKNSCDAGTVKTVIRVLPGLGQDLDRRRKTAVQVLIDGTNSNTASLISSYAGEIIATYAGAVAVKQEQARRFSITPGSINLRTPRLEARSRVWFNPDLRSRNYFVPGVMANLLMVVTVMLTGMAIVREKEIGTMEQLMVSPIRPIELMLGKTLPFALVGLIDIVLVTVVALLLFRVPFQGSFLLLLFCAALFLMTSLGVGLFISTIFRAPSSRPSCLLSLARLGNQWVSGVVSGLGLSEEAVELAAGRVEGALLVFPSVVD